jgi:dCMP deaminase
MSDDPHTQNGAVLVPKGDPRYPIYGANRLPRGIKIPKEEIASWPKEVKYAWMVHAEQSVIDLAALRGVQVMGATLYCPWFACTKCARSIIDSGIIRVVGHRERMDRIHPGWQDEIEEANAMLDMAGVARSYIEADLFEGDATYAILDRGELWTP